MSSINPVLILPEALIERAASIATGLAGSVTLGVGQFCTNPGLVLLGYTPEAEIFKETLFNALNETPPGVMLNSGIQDAYQQGMEDFRNRPGMEILIDKPQPQGTGCQVQASLFEVKGEDFLREKEFSRELFGPGTVLVRYADEGQLLDIINTLEGQLTASVHGSDGDIAANGEAIAGLQRKSGRLVYNGFPTGVEVCHSMVHGGPYPSTSDGRSTSVGTHAIERFCRYAAYQDCPDAKLPPELQEGNPLGIYRLVDGQFSVH